MKIHEYQAKNIFKNHGIPVPQGALADTWQKASAIARGLGSYPVVLKAQIHAGGRGRGGGVKPAQSLAEVEEFGREIIGMNLISSQTGPAGKKVGKILVEAGVAIEQELYLSFTHHRPSASIAIIASKHGGMDIEEVSAVSPGQITTVLINPLHGLDDDKCHDIGAGLQLPAELQQDFMQLLVKLFTIFIQYDCTLLEINPLAITRQGLMVLDAKIEIDDNALFRQPEIRKLQDPSETDELEAEAAKHKLNYIKLTGNVGSMVNGAGLAMATMDLIKQAGAEPANFLDLGGGATSTMVEKGFEIILQDKNVQVILINIFGGILRCDVLARGIVQAVGKAKPEVPLIIRLEGTNAEEGKAILGQSGVNFIMTENLKEATDKITAITRQ